MQLISDVVLIAWQPPKHTLYIAILGAVRKKFHSLEERFGYFSTMAEGLKAPETLSSPALKIHSR